MLYALVFVYFCVFSYGSTAYKNVMFYNLDWVPTYAKTHTDNQGNWVDPVAEQNYMNGAVMVLQLLRIKKRWESGEDGTAGWGLNLLPTRPRTRPRTCRLRKLGRKNPFPSLFQTPSFFSQLNNYLASQGKGKGKSKDYDSNDLYDRESEEE
ncbi:hypothetical protein Hanom_Chr01g00042091 [Helianthus anomalus]